MCFLFEINVLLIGILMAISEDHYEDEEVT